ncbi:MAG: peptide methionine sulfoxide reductase [Herbinix sp.]|nr:peptide methionine sulfoxide reductase [Herbinix sp.]
MQKDNNLKEIYLAGGCFWGTEKYLDNISGIVQTDVGYANGNTEDPTYQEVCHNNTGHAETVHVIYDPKQIRLAFILTLYYDVIDPTSVNRQGGDTGAQYRTGIYYLDEVDLPIIQGSLQELQSHYEKPIAIEVQPLRNYYLAEEYHQKYLDKNPSGYCHIHREKFDQAKSAKDDVLI